MDSKTQTSKLPGGATLFRSGFIRGIQKPSQPIPAPQRGSIVGSRAVPPKDIPPVVPAQKVQTANHVSQSKIAPVVAPASGRTVRSRPNTVAPPVFDLSEPDSNRENLRVPVSAHVKTPLKSMAPALNVPKPREYNFDETRSREEHIQYFKDLVAEEVQYMRTLADHYDGIYRNIGPESHGSRLSQDAAELILSAVGQARLLSTKKIQQFVELIADCEFHRGTQKTDPTDLAGFWEMINMQVVSIHNKFDSLATLARNDWKTPMKSTVDGARFPKKAPVPAKKKSVLPPVQASSKIREAIEAARRNKSAPQLAPEVASEEGSHV